MWLFLPMVFTYKFQVCAKSATTELFMSLLVIRFVEAKISTWMCVFSFNKSTIQTHEGANAKFSTNLDETNYSACKDSIHLTFGG